MIKNLLAVVGLAVVIRQAYEHYLQFRKLQDENAYWHRHKYCAYAYRKLLDQFGMQASMSRKGNCHDNAPMESFWGSLKNELTHQQRYPSRAHAKAAIREYIEIFYNRQRRHSRLGYVAPAVFADAFKYAQAA
jgi:putative transposase